MTGTETDIRDSLRRLLAAIKASDGASVEVEMGRIEDVLGRERDRLTPRLAHFLQNRSYAKALALLDSEAGVPSGTCGGR